MDDPRPDSVNPNTGGRPPGYGEALAILSGVLLGLLAMHALQAPRLPRLEPLPAALATFLPAGMALLAGFLQPESRAARFFSGLPFSLTALGFTAGAALLGSLILQNPSPEDALRLGRAYPLLQRLGFTDLFRAPWFGGLLACLILALAVATGRRLRTWSLRNAIFAATHLGTALVLTGGAFAALASRSGQVRILEGEGTRTVHLDRGRTADLPAELRLAAFHIEPYELEVSLTDGEGLRPRRTGRPLPHLVPGAIFRAGNWTVSCLEAIPSARPQLSLVPDPAGELVLDLRLEAHGGAADVTLAASMGVRRLAGGLVAALMEVPPDRMPEAVDRAREALDGDGAPGLAILSDGTDTRCLIRSLDGHTELRRDPHAFEPVRFGALTLVPGRPHRARITGTWLPAEGRRLQPTAAARLAATRGTERREAWLAAGPEGADPLRLDPDTALVLLPPQPKRFRSEVSLEGRPATIQVNAPLRLGSWDLVQVGYEEGPGGRAYTVLKAAADPSIGPVYAGLLLLLGGVVGALWILPRTWEAP